MLNGSMQLLNSFY